MTLLMPENREPNRHLPATTAAARLRKLVSDRDALGQPGQARILLNHAHRRTTTRPRPQWVGKPAPNACFANSVAAVSSHHASGLSYVEGYAYQAELDIAYEHAWLEDPTGTVIETTWPMPAQAYFGLALPVATLFDLLGQHDSESFVFGDWARDFTLLRTHAECCSLPWMRTA